MHSLEIQKYIPELKSFTNILSEIHILVEYHDENIPLYLFLRHVSCTSIMITSNLYSKVLFA